MLDLVYPQPLLNVALVKDRLAVAKATAGKPIEQFAALDLIEETTGGQRNRRYRYTPYLAWFEEPADNISATASLQTTESEAAP